MAKRRGRRSSARKSGQARVSRVAPRAAAETRSKSEEPDFASEYRYVLGDLKRIAILAAGMFATLVVLALVIR